MQPIRHGQLTLAARTTRREDEMWGNEQGERTNGAGNSSVEVMWGDGRKVCGAREDKMRRQSQASGPGRGRGQGPEL